jgi:Flp pilus assembly protein TadB
VSKERRRAREAREAAAAEQRAAAERTAARRAKVAALAPPTPHRPHREPVYRLRRFPRLPWRLKAALGLGWLATVALVMVLFSSWTGRLGLVLLATAALPLIVVLVRDPSRRNR